MEARFSCFLLFERLPEASVADPTAIRLPLLLNPKPEARHPRATTGGPWQMAGARRGRNAADARCCLRVSEPGGPDPESHPFPARLAANVSSHPICRVGAGPRLRAVIGRGSTTRMGDRDLGSRSLRVAVPAPSELVLGKSLGEKVLQSQ